MLDWVDRGGRRLGEQASPQQHPDGTRLHKCPYHDARRGGLMNTAAYRQVDAHWSTVLAALREASGPSAAHAWQATCRLRWMPLHLGEPVEEEHAAMFKTALGLTRPLSSWLLLHPGAAAAPLHELVSVDEVVGRLDAEGWLLGAREVCPAPVHRIREAWEALAEPSATTELPASAIETADRARDIVVGLWAILGATRAAITDGRAEHITNWSPIGEVDPEWPEVLVLLRKNGPGALVREVPRFEPAWALHVFDDPPPAVATAVRAAQQAMKMRDPWRALDAAWRHLVAPLR